MAPHTSRGRSPLLNRRILRIECRDCDRNKRLSLTQIIQEVRKIRMQRSVYPNRKGWPCPDLRFSAGRHFLSLLVVS